MKNYKNKWYTNCMIKNLLSEERPCDLDYMLLLCRNNLFASSLIFIAIKIIINFYYFFSYFKS